MLGNLLLMLLSLIGIVCGVWFLSEPHTILVGRVWDAVTGAGILGNAVVFGVNLYEAMCPGGDEA